MVIHEMSAGVADLEIERHDMRIVGPPREYYLNDPFEVGIDKAETEIEFPIAAS